MHGRTEHLVLLYGEVFQLDFLENPRIRNKWPIEA
jgi:hypothetical protein